MNLTSIRRIRTMPILFALFSIVAVCALPVSAAERLTEWDKSPEAYFLTGEERDAWKRTVHTEDDAKKFIAEYFRKRGEQFRKDLNTRFEYAGEKFSLGKVPGANTARGRVFILLGPPSEQQVRTGVGGATGSLERPMTADDTIASTPRMNSVERQALTATRWTYRRDRLPQELGLTELTVNFQTDEFRGYEVIDNVGQVEPYLTKVATLISGKYIEGQNALGAARATGPSTGQLSPGASTTDPLWSAEPAPQGVIYIGDSYVSPTDAPFYALSAFVPPTAAPLAEWQSVLMVSLIRDASGAQVVSDRRQLDLKSYDDTGARYLDHSYPLAPGRYEGMFAMYSPEGTTLLSSERRFFEVPASTQSRASSLLLSSRIDVLEKQEAFDPFTFVALKYAVRGDRSFRKSDKISFFTVVANPSGTPQANLMQRLTFTRDGQPFFRSPLEPVQAVQTGPNTFLVGVTFEPDTFGPGRYALELQVRDFNAAEGSELRTKGYVLNTEFQVADH